MVEKEALENNLNIEETVFLAANAAEDKKSIETQVIDVRAITDYYDYLIIASGDSVFQLKAIAGQVEDSLSEYGLEPSHAEGKRGDRWILLDYSDFVVHVIDENLRDYYKLEEFWGHGIFIDKNEWHR